MMRALFVAVLLWIPIAADAVGPDSKTPSILSCWKSPYRLGVGRFFVWILDDGGIRVQDDRNVCRAATSGEGPSCTLREDEPVTLPAAAAVTKSDRAKVFALTARREIEVRQDATHVNDVRARLVVEGQPTELALVACGSSL